MIHLLRVLRCYVIGARGLAHLQLSVFLRVPCQKISLYVSYPIPLIDHLSVTAGNIMRSIGDTMLLRWYRMLHLPRQSPPSWYRDRLREELQERRTAETPLRKLSETSDVLFSSIRAQYDGFPLRRLQSLSSCRYILVYGYMLAKFTSRWKFYRTAAILCKVPHFAQVCEVVNPSKDHKLKEVALRHQIDPTQFQKVGRQLRRMWPLLP